MKILLRIILSPFIFLYGIFLLTAGTFLVFPLGFLVMFSLIGLLSVPIAKILNKGGSKIEFMDPFINNVGSVMLGHFLGMTIHIWGAFAIVVLYVKTGKIFTGE